MKEKIVLRVYKNLIKVVLFVFIFNVVFNIGAFYGEFKELNEGVKDFFTKETEIKINNTYTMDLPQEYQYKIDNYNEIVNKIWYTLIAIFFYAIADIVEKGQHKKFINKIKNSLGGE